MRAWNFEAVGLSVCSAASRSVGQCRLATVLGGLVLGGMVHSAAAQTTLLVADHNGDKVVRFDYTNGETNGEAIDHFVGKGISPLGQARYMTQMPNGNLLVSSQANHSVQMYNSRTGKFIETLITSGSGGLNEPNGLTYGPDGSLFVASGASDQVLRYDGATGDYLGIAATGINRPVNIEFSANGTMFVSAFSSDRVMMFDPSDGTYLDDVDMSGTGLNNPHGMTQDTAGNIYVASAESSRVIRIEAGTWEASIFVTPGSGGLDNPLGIGFDDAGNLLVVSSRTTSVLKYDANGQFLETVFFAANDGGLTRAIGLLLYTPCTADFNDDGTVNTQDFIAFLSVWAAGCP